LDAVFCAYQNANKAYIIILINNYHYIKFDSSSSHFQR